VRIAVSGSHCSGKTTLVEHFMAKHPDYIHEPEPYEWLTELRGEIFSGEETSAADFWQQLDLSVERLSTYSPGAKVIAERSPLDFVAYLQAIGELGREDTSLLVRRAFTLAGQGMRHIDLLVVLPLSAKDSIEAPESEDRVLREAMNVCLLDILADAAADRALLGRSRVIEVTGTEEERLAALEHALRPSSK
jgi:AAA domain